MAQLIKEAVSFPDSAPARVAIDVQLDSSPEEVWDLLIDSPGWVKWFPGVTSCTYTSDPAHGIGATRRIVVNGLQADEEIIAWEPNRLWAFTVYETNRTFARRWVERVTISPSQGGSHVHYATGLELLTLAKLFRPILTRGIRKSWSAGLDGIDAYLANP